MRKPRDPGDFGMSRVDTLIACLLAAMIVAGVVCGLLFLGAQAIEAIRRNGFAG